MSTKKDLEELEDKRLCHLCEFKDRGINGEWCYMQVEAPIGSKCIKYVLKRTLREAAAIQGLYNKFPDLNEG